MERKDMGLMLLGILLGILGGVVANLFAMAFWEWYKPPEDLLFVIVVVYSILLGILVLFLYLVAMKFLRKAQGDEKYYNK